MDTVGEFVGTVGGGEIPVPYAAHFDQTPPDQPLINNLKSVMTYSSFVVFVVCRLTDR
jgi:hypothetical protein